MQVSDVVTAVKAIRGEVDNHNRAAGYYHGEIGELFTSDAVKRALRGSAGGFDINLARRPVDAVLDRVRILALSVPDDEATTERLLAEVWRPNRMDRRAKTVHWASLVHGDAYLIVWPGEDEEPEIHYNAPSGCRVFYDQENPQVKSHAAKLWCEGTGDDKVHRLTLYYTDRIERYITKAGTKGDEIADWLAYTDEDGDVWPTPNPYGEVPVFHFRTGEPYGRPEHRGAFGPQNAITKLSATLMATVDFAGFPQRYAITNASEITQTSVFDDDENPEQGPSIEAGPGKMLNLPGVDAVGQFDPADMDSFLKPLGFYVRAMAAATATPLRFFDPQGQIPSGEALRADEAPLAQRIVDHEELWEETWSEVLVFAAKVAGFDVPAVDVKWAPVQTVDDLSGWQTVSAKQAAGVPARQALVEAGYTADLVDGWLQDSEKSNLDTRVAALGEIGKALQLLGSAVQLGAVDQATVSGIIGQVLGDLVREGDAE